LDRLKFIETIQELRGEGLREFYELAAARAVRFTDPAAIARWQRLLKPSAR
jgi:hypothetical protein